MIRRVPSLLWESTERIITVGSVVLTILVYLSPKFATSVVISRWATVARQLAWVPVVLLVMRGVLKANYERFHSLELILRQYEEEKVPKIKQPRAEAPRGLLDFQVDAARTSDQIVKIMSGISKRNYRMAKRFPVHTARFSRLQAWVLRLQAKGKYTDRRALKFTQRALRIASDAARDMNTFSTFLEKMLGPLRERTNSLGESWIGWFERLAPSSGDAQKELGQFCDGTVRPLLQTTGTTREVINVFRKTIAGLRGIGMSQTLNSASERLLSAVDEMLQVIGSLEDSLAEVVAVINRKLKQTSST